MRAIEWEQIRKQNGMEQKTCAVGCTTNELFESLDACKLNRFITFIYSTRINTKLSLILLKHFLVAIFAFAYFVHSIFTIYYVLNIQLHTKKINKFQNNENHRTNPMNLKFDACVHKVLINSLSCLLLLLFLFAFFRECIKNETSRKILHCSVCIEYANQLNFEILFSKEK